MSKKRFYEGQILGEGSFGKVKYEHGYANKYMKGIDKSNGIDATILREIAALKHIEHKNIVKMIELIYDDEDHPIAIKFECCDSDLKSYLRTHYCTGITSEAIRKKVFIDMCKGLNYIHSNGFLHRDLKPQNTFINIKSGENIQVKIGDLGLVKKILKQNFTPTVVTLWYRCPELLLNTNMNKAFDSPALDIWSLGLIFMEIMTNQSELKGDSEIGQIMEIFKLLGTPTKSEWPEYESSEHFNPQFPKMESKLDSRLNSMTNSTKKEHTIIKSMLKFKQSERKSCEEILKILKHKETELELN